MKKFLLLFVLVLIGCQQTSTDVVVTLLPFQHIVQEIAGPNTSVSVMVPPGANPHTYEPSPSKIREVSQAKMYVKAGSGIEFEVAWFDKIRSINEEMLVVDASQGLEVQNPHIWLSLKNLETIATNIYEGLIQVYPENKQEYKRNLDAYTDRIEKIDESITVRDKSFVTFHPAWEYVARDYNLTQVPISTEGKEPTFQDIQNVISQIKEQDISIILVSPQFSTRYADTISQETDARIVRADTLAPDTAATIQQIAQVIQNDSAQ
ncbi:MAG: metal ABC transporter solute-binding protein, Zn/Mn family [Nanobdellota archaeon]